MWRLGREESDDGLICAVRTKERAWRRWRQAPEALWEEAGGRAFCCNKQSPVTVTSASVTQASLCHRPALEEALLRVMLRDLTSFFRATKHPWSPG